MLGHLGPVATDRVGLFLGQNEKLSKQRKPTCLKFARDDGRKSSSVDSRICASCSKCSKVNCNRQWFFCAKVYTAKRGASC